MVGGGRWSLSRTGVGQTATGPTRPACQADHQDARALCLLRHHWEHPAIAEVRTAGHTDVAEMAGTTHPLKAAPMGPLQRVPRTSPASPRQDHSPVRNVSETLPRRTGCGKSAPLQVASLPVATTY